MSGDGVDGVAAPPAGEHVHGVEQNILVVGLDSRSGLSPAERRLLWVRLTDISIAAWA